MIYSPLAAYAKGGRVKPILTKQAPLSDPLAQAVAIRMQALLDKGAELENLPAKGLNLSAAYAGDQRSQQALQRRLSEQQTGLQDPSRRKFMKQTAATAAKQALPGLPGVGTVIKAAQLLDKAAPVTTEVTDEVIQAAIAKSMSMLNKGALAKLGEISGEGGVLEDLIEAMRHNVRGTPLDEDTAKFLLDDLDDFDITPEEQADILEALDFFEPKTIAAHHGLPEEAITNFLMRNQLESPANELVRMLDDAAFFNDSFYDFGYKDQFRDTVFSDPFEDSFDDEIIKALKAGEWSKDGFDSPADYVHDCLVNKQCEKAYGRYEKLLGKDFHTQEGAPMDVKSAFEEAQGTMLDNNDLYNYYLSEHAEDILDKAGINPEDFE